MISRRDEPVFRPGDHAAVNVREGQPEVPPAAALAAEDRRLVEACLARAPGAWDDFVARYAGLLFHVVDRSTLRRRIGISAADRDDLVAEVLLECLRDDAAVLRRFAGRASLPTYLTVIARRVVVRSLVRLARTGRLAPPDGPEPVARGDQFGGIADREQVESLLGQLDERDARLLRLHHLEARSYGEISRLTGMPLGSIGPALSRAKARLRTLRDAG